MASSKNSVKSKPPLHCGPAHGPKVVSGHEEEELIISSGGYDLEGPLRFERWFG